MEPVQTTNIVDVYVNYLRRKLHDVPPGLLIRTVRGKGYMIPVEGEIASFANMPACEYVPFDDAALAEPR